jgi:phenylacetate-CoA ligase
VLLALPGYAGEYRIIVSRDEAMDELVVQAEVDLTTQADPALLGKFREQLAKDLRTTLGVRATVRVEPPGTLPRTEFKARRVVDNRDLYHQAQAAHG